MNAQTNVTRKVEYNETISWIMSSSAHSESNTTIENGNDTSLLGEVWTLLEYTMRKSNIHGYSDGIYMQCFPILNSLSLHDTDEGETIFLLDNEGIIHIS